MQLSRGNGLDILNVFYYEPAVWSAHCATINHPCQPRAIEALGTRALGPE